MATVAGVEAERKTPAQAVRTAARRRSFPVWRWVILLVAAIYFLIPLYAALRFAGLERHSVTSSSNLAFIPRSGCRCASQ